MKYAVIGAGNMGAAIVGAIVKSGHEVWVSNRSQGKLDALKTQYPDIHTTLDNVEAAKHAEVIILAIKPVYLEDVGEQIAKTVNLDKQTIVSVVGGNDTVSLALLFGDVNLYHTFYQVIPDTAIMVGHGMTFITALNPDDKVTESLKLIFSNVGEVAFIPERLMGAATALSSCGIAYVYKYIQASVQAGVELGFTVQDALKFTLATVDGAVAMLEREGATPQGEIDRVCSPGGMTIRGINALEQQAFTATVINAIKKPLQS